MRILLALLLSGFAAHGAVTGAVQADSTKHVTQPSGFWTAQPGDSTFVSAVRAAQSSTSITGAVASVQGKAGIVSLTTSDIPEGTNFFWTTVRSNNLTAALWQFAVAYFYALSNPSNFVIASAGQVTNNVNSDIAVVRSLAANGNATFSNHGNAGPPLVVDAFNGTNNLAEFIDVVSGRAVKISPNADIAIGAGVYSGNGSGLTNLPASQLSGTVADARLSANVTLVTTNAFSMTASNSLPLTPNLIAPTFLLTLNGAGALTNTSGTGWANIILSNATATGTNYYFTNATWRAIGAETTNDAPGGVLAIPAGKVAFVTVQNQYGFTAYWITVQRTP